MINKFYSNKLRYFVLFALIIFVGGVIADQYATSAAGAVGQTMSASTSSAGGYSGRKFGFATAKQSDSGSAATTPAEPEKKPEPVVAPATPVEPGKKPDTAKKTKTSQKTTEPVKAPEPVAAPAAPVEPTKPIVAGPTPKANSDQLLSELIELMNKATEEKEKNKKVSPETKEATLGKLNLLMEAYKEEAKSFRDSGDEKGAKIVEKSGEIIELSVTTQLKDDVKSEDLEKVQKAQDELQALVNERTEATKSEDLTPQQKGELKVNAVKEIQESITRVVQLVTGVKNLIENITAKTKKGFGLGLVTSVVSGDLGELNVLKSLLSYLQSFSKNLQTTLSNVQKLASV